MSICSLWWLCYGSFKKCLCNELIKPQKFNCVFSFVFSHIFAKLTFFSCIPSIVSLKYNITLSQLNFCDYLKLCQIKGYACDYLSNKPEWNVCHAFQLANSKALVKNLLVQVQCCIWVVHTIYIKYSVPHEQLVNFV